MINRSVKFLFLLAVEAAGCEFAIGIASTALVFALVSAPRLIVSRKFRVR